MKTTKSAQPLTDLRKWIDELTAVQPVTDTHDLIDQCKHTNIKLQSYACNDV